MNSSLFKSFFIGGFECSSHRRHSNGEHLDLIASTMHDKFAFQDYKRLHSMRIKTARDGIRWHLIEKSEGHYDWTSVLEMFRAMRETNTQIVWDLLHFGWPDDIDIFKPSFVDRFANFAKAFIIFHMNESDDVPFVVPVNEPSFLSFACGEKGFFYPYAQNRGNEIKTQLVRAIIEACENIRNLCPQARIIHTDPVINIIPHPNKPEERDSAKQYCNAQFESWDMISGKSHPNLGGNPKYLDVMGVNYYINNQWIHNSEILVPSHPYHLPLRYLLKNVHDRYTRPLFISETGIEGQNRPAWFRYIGKEVLGSLSMKIPLEGVCIYPIVDHPGWDDDRYCPNGLWGYADAIGNRKIYEPLARELTEQQDILSEINTEDEVSLSEGWKFYSEKMDSVLESVDWSVMDTADIALKNKS